MEKNLFFLLKRPTILRTCVFKDVGQVMPGAVMVVVKIQGPEANTEKPRLCKTDEVGELCVSSGASGKEYWVSLTQINLDSARL